MGSIFQINEPEAALSQTNLIPVDKSDDEDQKTRKASGRKRHKAKGRKGSLKGSLESVRSEPEPEVNLDRDPDRGSPDRGDTGSLEDDVYKDDGDEKNDDFFSQ